jgi:anti-sigma regulatory factor (Ser/Thr protein kinase)
VSAAAVFAVRDASQVAAVRREAARLAERLGFGESDAGRLALVVTEFGTNLVKHGTGGEIVLVERRFPAGGVDVLALDRGPGMDLATCLRDGFSTAGTAGTGLGAVRRLADRFDAYSRPNAGAALLARIDAGPCADRPPVEVAGVATAMPGETACGDAWSAELWVEGACLVMADGLGHGEPAAAAAREAVRAFAGARPRPPAERLQAIHDALRSTRGAAVAVAAIDTGHRVVRFAGLGNVSAVILGDGPPRHLASHNGTAGAGAARVREYTYPWRPNDALVVHTDGLASLRDPGAYPGLLVRHPALIAGVLYRDHRRGRDDAAVVVAASRPTA